MQETTRHEMIIRTLLERYPSAERARFAASMKALFSVNGVSPNEVAGMVPAIRPDAFMIDRGIRVVTVFEVEDSSRISHVLMNDLLWLWTCLSDIDYSLTLVPVSRWGAEAVVDLGRYAALARERRNTAPPPAFMLPVEAE